MLILERVNCHLGVRIFKENKMVNLWFSHCCSLHLRDCSVIPVATVIYLSENPKELSLEVDCPLILFLFESGVVDVQTKS